MVIGSCKTYYESIRNRHYCVEHVLFSFWHLGRGFGTFRPQKRIDAKIRPRHDLHIPGIEDQGHIKGCYVFHFFQTHLVSTKNTLQ